MVEGISSWIECQLRLGDHLVLLFKLTEKEKQIHENFTIQGETGVSKCEAGNRENTDEASVTVTDFSIVKEKPLVLHWDCE